MIKMLKFATIPTADQDRAVAFWTEQVGFRIVTDQPMGDGKRWIELGIPGAETGVVLFTQPEHEDRIGTPFNGSFACDDVAYTAERMQARGVTFVEAPTKTVWGSFAKFRDPDGNVFVLSGK